MPESAEMQALIRRVAQAVKETTVRVAVVGDMILDRSIEGEPGGSHPETRVAILRDASIQESIGGAGNIALALSRLGVQVSLFGIIGPDLPGRQLMNLLDRQPVQEHLVTQRGWPTPQKDWISRREGHRVQMVERIDYDRPLPGEAREELVGEFRARCPADVQVVLLADHGLGSIGPESLGLIGLAKEQKAKIVAIPRTPVLRGQPVDAIVLNAFEMRPLAQAGPDADPKQLAARYAREYRQHVFLTLFEEGLMVCPAGKSGPGTLIPGYPLENPEWMGTRDLTTGIVAVGLALDMDPLDIGKVCSVFRHLIACQRGNGRVLWRDVFQFVGLEAEAP